MSLEDSWSWYSDVNNSLLILSIPSWNYATLKFIQLSNVFSIASPPMTWFHHIQRCFSLCDFLFGCSTAHAVSAVYFPAKHTYTSWQNRGTNQSGYSHFRQQEISFSDVIFICLDKQNQIIWSSEVKQTQSGPWKVTMWPQSLHTLSDIYP